MANTTDITNPSRRKVLKGVAAIMAVGCAVPAAQIASAVTDQHGYTAVQYFNERCASVPDAGVTFRNGRIVKVTGWSPEYVNACGVEDPWGQFFQDWLQVLDSHGMVFRKVHS